jgi:dihydroorotate dehydrogenase
MFRLSEDQAVINRYGFNSDGHAAVLERLKTRVERYLRFTPNLILTDKSLIVNELPAETNKSLEKGKLLGINLGKNKISPANSDADYINGVKTLGGYADYIVINISSPNTPGLRALQRREPIERLLKSALKERDALTHRPPLLVKIAPDLNDAEMEDIAAVCSSVGIDGVVISNTTLARPNLTSTHQTETGGLSGAPLFPIALQAVRKFYTLTNGAIPIVGCGGIKSAEDALAFCKAGASVVQVYTALGYSGPKLVDDIKSGLAQELEKEGKSWAEMVGSGNELVTVPPKMVASKKTKGWFY